MQESSSQKISISIDEDILGLIDAERGDVPRSKYIENAIRKSGSFFEALWISSDEFETITAKERWLSPHTSQPVGKPLHKHEGYLVLSGNYMHFYNKNKELVLSIERGSIKDISVTYDDVFRRFRDSRGLNPPMRITLDKNKIYLFTKLLGKKGLFRNSIYKGENTVIELWYKSNPDNSFY